MYNKIGFGTKMQNWTKNESIRSKEGQNPQIFVNTNNSIGKTSLLRMRTKLFWVCLLISLEQVERAQMLVVNCNGDPTNMPVKFDQNWIMNSMHTMNLYVVVRLRKSEPISKYNSWLVVVS